MAPRALQNAKYYNGSEDSRKRFHASTTSEAMEAESAFAAHNYHPLPIVFAKAKGASVWDPVGDTGTANSISSRD